MSTIPRTPARAFAPPAPMRPAPLALAGAVAFLALYLAVDVVGNLVASGPLPMPDAPRAEVYEYMAGNGPALLLTGLLHLASVTGLLTFIVVVRSRSTVEHGRAGWGHRAGVAAVAALAVSAALAFVVAATASSLSVDTVYALRTVNFLAGGVVHVALLGLYVWLTRSAYTPRGVRIFGAVAAVPAFLSLTSLVLFYGNAFILLGRLLCMAWTVAAAVALVRAARTAYVERRTP